MPTEAKPIVLVTGSSGLIGARLIDKLSSDYRIIGLDIEAPKELPEQANHIHCDLTSDESVDDALGEIRSDFGETIATVVHLAAYYDFSGEPSPLYEELTVGGTRRLLYGLRRFHVEQFLFTSTLLVMESSEDGHPVTASSPIDAEWDYPQSKIKTEQLIAAERGETPAVILRLAGVYDEQCHSVPLAQQISRIHQKQLESYLFPGDKTHGQSFIHLEDAIECLRSAIAQRAELPPYEVFVIGEEDVMSYEELQDALGKLIHDKEWPTIRIPKAVAKAGAWAKEKMAGDEADAPFIKPWMIDLADQNYPVNLHRARQSLKWEPQHTLRGTLPEMVAQLKRDPRKWYGVNGLPVPEELQAETARTS
jgi:nucleoside-diphosphate-sugar epimerase